MRTPSEFPTMMKPIGIRLTASEHATITTVARADGRSVAAYVRRLVQEHIGTEPIQPVPTAMTAKGMKVEYEKPVDKDAQELERFRKFYKTEQAPVDLQPLPVQPPEVAKPILGVNDKVQAAATLLRKAMGTGDPDNVAAILRHLAMKYQDEDPVIEEGEEVTFMTRVRRMANARPHEPSDSEVS